LKITKDELTLVNDDALSKFYSGIKSQVTRKDYDKILKRVLCDILEDVLEGDYSQRARQICTRAKAEPLWIDSLLNVIAVKLKKRTELPKTDKTYLNPKIYLIVTVFSEFTNCLIIVIIFSEHLFASFLISLCQILIT